MGFAAYEISVLDSMQKKKEKRFNNNKSPIVISLIISSTKQLLSLLTAGNMKDKVNLGEICIQNANSKYY